MGEASGAHVFLSYKREDQAAAQRLVEQLRQAGLAVWWDQDIPPDAPWEDTIERELIGAGAVIVGWSAASVASENVKAEARRARTDGKLIQVFLEDCAPPLFFGERQGVSLAGWTGDAKDHRFRTVVTATRAVLEGRAPPQGVGYAPRRRALPVMSLGVGLTVLAVLAVAMFVGGERLFGLGYANPPPSAPTAAGPADPAAARARLLAGLNGDWGRQDQSCVDKVTIRVERGADGVERIVMSQGSGWRSSGQIMAADNGVVFSRDTDPGPNGAREQHEFRPDGDALILKDARGVSTAMVRCG